MKPPIKLLVVDDDLEFRRYLTPLLHGKGYQVMEAATGVDGLRLVQENAPDLVLLDVALPDLNGLVICKQIKAEPALAGTFVVLISREAVSWEDRSAGLSVGADEYLAKPVAPRDYLSWVQTMVRTQLAEKQMHASERRFRALVERASDAVALLDERGAFRYLSPSATPILGYSADELLGRNAFELIHPDDLPLASSLFHQLLENPRGSQESGVRYRHKNGSWRWLDGVATNLLDEPSVRGVVINFRDITERTGIEQALEASKARLAGIVNLAMDAIISIDASHRIILFNAAAEEMFQCQASDVLGQPINRFVPKRFRAQHRSHIEEFGETNLTSRRLGTLGTITGLRANGEEFPIEASISQTKVTGERIYTVILRDITERIAARDRLKLLSRRLIEAQETERRSIAREIHDEIGQVILAVEMNLQSAMRLVQGTEVVPLIQESIVILERVLRQAHDLALNLRPTMLDDLGLVPALRWYTNQQAQRAGLRVEFFADSLPARLDPAIDTVCYRVGQEAVTNVVRHAKAQALSVQLLREADQLHLIVYDDGVGFDVKATRRSAGANAKLGLLGMEERVSLADGRIEFKSAPGQGTEIHAWFPLSMPAQPQV